MSRTLRKNPKKALAELAQAEPSPQPFPLLLPHFGPWQRLLLLPFSVLYPGCGFLLAALYAPQVDPVARRFGRWALALAVLGSLLHLFRTFHGDSLQGTDNLNQPYY